jgi:crossover junction endodeoxyribonuclease RusA
LIKLILPIPPSANAMYKNAPRTAKGGKRYTGRDLTDTYKTYRDNMWYRCKQRKIPKLTGRVSIWIMVQFADKRDRDIDNLVKTLLDSLQYAQILENDKQVDSLWVMRGPLFEGGRVIVILGDFDAAAALGPWQVALSDPERPDHTPDKPGKLNGTPRVRQPSRKSRKP